MATRNPNQEPQADETTGRGSPELIGQPPHPTPGQAEGDRETVEENLGRMEKGGRTKENKDA